MICGCGCGQPVAPPRKKYATEECAKRGAREALLLKRFNMTLKQYEDILAAQGGVCPICLKAPRKTAYPVDHDHKTGLVRGIPCTGCNLIMIRNVRDSAKFRRAADYLDNPPAVAVIGEVTAPNRPRTRRKRNYRK